MDELLQSLVLSASLGALIGLIRQWGEQQEGDADTTFAGLRTFVLWSLVGFASAYISTELAPFAFIAGMLLVGGHIVLRSVFASEETSVGFTTGAAGIVTVLIGGLCYWNQTTLAVVMTGITMLVIGLKHKSHTWTLGFTQEDIRSTLQFVAVTGVVLPLVPNQGYGPYEAFNPYNLWLMVVLISGLGFVGYILMRMLGTKAGVALTGVVGGMASSTATTLAFSKESKAYPELSGGFAMAIVMACTIMVWRVLLILGLIYPPFVRELWLPFLIFSIPGLLYALWAGLLSKQGKEATDIPNLKNPLGLSIAIKFALIYAVISLLVKLFSSTELNQGLLALSFLSGLTDMDAIALSITNNLKDGVVATDLAVKAVIIAAIANTVLKAGLVFSLGSAPIKKHIGIALGSTVIAGIGTCIFF